MFRSQNLQQYFSNNLGYPEGEGKSGLKVRIKVRFKWETIMWGQSWPNFFHFFTFHDTAIWMLMKNQSRSSHTLVMEKAFVFILKFTVNYCKIFLTVMHRFLAGPPRFSRIQLMLKQKIVFHRTEDNIINIMSSSIRECQLISLLRVEITHQYTISKRGRNQ